jgi:hypothetical protein
MTSLAPPSGWSRGAHQLEGVPGSREVFAVAG